MGLTILGIVRPTDGRKLCQPDPLKTPGLSWRIRAFRRSGGEIFAS
ncbi:hypothetical protein HMPREF9440_01000 [Sutterella parvirubra YIT 11816]|uniref:Uncharacterized protein n=1 Tax=Sutterella parvirubra YIT 11816 TaxID=762967 RepID=H3KE39_9BURK|nr:hypothetical protein HMPREF9440_01000 [Sutterella parvirubra YIT 11816]